MKKLISYQKNFYFIFLILFLCSFINWIALATQNHNHSNQTLSSKLEKPTLKTISGIAKVIDGDSIKIKEKNIRLIGIDAPEFKQKCLDKNYHEYYCGKISTTFLKQLVNKKNIQCEYSKKDMYGRYLGSCNLENININYEMIKNGMAIIYNLKNTDEELKNLENKARNKKIGIWQGAFLEPRKYRKKNRRN